jgi:hypothetical protein
VRAVRYDGDRPRRCPDSVNCANRRARSSGIFKNTGIISPTYRKIRQPLVIFAADFPKSPDFPL